MEYERISPLQIEVTWDGVVATVTVTGELDITTAPGLMERLLKVTKVHPERLVLDLDSLVFVDVAGARALDKTRHLLQAECPVTLRQPGPRRAGSSGSLASWTGSAAGMASRQGRGVLRADGSLGHHPGTARR
jgi:anti-anti-sigma factor